MKGGAAGEIIGCRSAQCTHAITVGLLASRVTYSHSRVETPSRSSTTADPGTVQCILVFIHQYGIANEMTIKQQQIGKRC